MKTKLLLLSIILLPALTFAGNTTGKNSTSTEKESTKISLYIPGFLMKIGSWCVDKKEDAEAKLALKHMRSISVIVREGCAYKEYVASKKYDKKLRKLDRQNFESLVSVDDQDTNVSVQLKQNKNGKIRQLAVIVNDSEESFVFARVRCNVSINELKSWMQDGSAVNKILLAKINI